MNFELEVVQSICVQKIIIGHVGGLAIKNTGIFCEEVSRFLLT